MLYLGNTALALEILALVGATALLLYTKKSESACRGFAGGVAYFAIVLSLLAMLCTLYRAFRYGGVEMFGAYGRHESMEGMTPEERKCPMMERMMKSHGAPEEPHE
ncbi:MAG TPA: hypothetical protein DF383_00790 [Deltaproteobacteria bacterium]|nr:hypothetical protein [Deltaproteobacteria bacterium]